MVTAMNASLADGFVPLIAFLRQFQREPGGDAAALSEKLDRLIADARRACRDAGFSETDVESALFAVVAWTDEILIAAAWSGAAEWPRRLLQKRYFNVANAGIAFFNRLEALEPQQLHVREVYFLCLGLGFAGRYGYDRNPKGLNDIKRDNLKLLLEDGDVLPAGAGKLLFPDGYGINLVPKENENAGQRRNPRWRFSAISLNAFAVPSAILAVLYLVYHVTIWQTVNGLLSQIK